MREVEKPEVPRPKSWLDTSSDDFLFSVVEKREVVRRVVGVAEMVVILWEFVNMEETPTLDVRIL